MSRIAWLAAHLADLCRQAHTGSVVVRIAFYRGGIRDVRVSREEDTASAP